MPVVDEAKLAKEKRERNNERRIMAAEKQKKATMKFAKSNMEITNVIDSHENILERSLLLFQPTLSSYLGTFSR